MINEQLKHAIIIGVYFAQVREAAPRQRANGKANYCHDANQQASASPALGQRKDLVIRLHGSFVLPNFGFNLTDRHTLRRSR